ncbi:hypothetical protein [Fructilactobacillus fructivorans]|uniref:hypothetical protein n=1 Tax=Fructilactobacillus fructivorans TaxID=1614 RepID=UPI0007054F01|nr:hypothetical protein [Fructilactobacillus fructivorans]KRN41826.1 hypothetical protein IV48_GL000667 [Fructilactobacillus fructivorans]
MPDYLANNTVHVNQLTGRTYGLASQLGFEFRTLGDQITFEEMRNGIGMDPNNFPDTVSLYVEGPVYSM